MRITGYACHFNKRNKNGEIVTAKSFEKSLQRHIDEDIVIPINYNHQSDVILGKVVEYRFANDGLIITAELNDDVDVVKNYVAPLVKDGTFNRFSTEGYISRDTIEKVSDDTYIANEFDLTAVAIVVNPADTDAYFIVNSVRGEGVHCLDVYQPMTPKVNKALYII